MGGRLSSLPSSFSTRQRRGVLMSTGLLYFRTLKAYMEAVQQCVRLGVYFEGTEAKQDTYSYCLEITGVKDND